MLKILRNKKTAKRIWIGLALIIVPAFVLWGSGSMVRDKESSGYAGRMFGKKIPYQKFRDALNATKNQMIMQFGDDLKDREKEFDLQAMAWERLLLLSEARKRKLSVSDSDVIAWIQSVPFFQRKGSFDNTFYLQLLEYTFRTPPRVFEEQVRENLILAKLFEEITSAVSLTDQEIHDAYRKANEKVAIYYVTAQISDFMQGVSFTDEEVSDYFRKNSSKFKQPLSFNLEYIFLEGARYNEEELKKKIQDMAGTLNKKGADFNKIASEFGTDIQVKETGIFSQADPIPGIGWAPGILNLVADLRPGQFLPLVAMDKNYYLIRLKEIKEPYIPDFESVKEKVREGLIREKSVELAKAKIEEALKKMREGYRLHPKAFNLEKAAKAEGLGYGATELFKYGSYIEGIGASDVFWAIGQGLKEDELSDPIATVSGFYVIKLKEKAPVDEETFAAEKKDFTRQLLQQKKMEYFGKFLRELRTKAQ